MTRLKIISTPTKTNQPNLNENKQTSSHVGKILASSGIKNWGIKNWWIKKRILNDVIYYNNYLHTFYFEESRELLDQINIKQLKVFQVLSRIRLSKFVRDGLPVEEAAEYADNFIRNFHDKKTRTRRSFVVSNINNVITETLQKVTANYQTA